MRTPTLVLLVALSAAAPAHSREPQEGMLQTEPGVEIYWREVGEGPPLIIPADFLLGEDFDYLSRSHRIIFYDMRNRGRSSTITDPELLTIEGDVHDLESLRDHFGIARFSTIGYSYLGKMVILYALRHPERIDRIIQIGPVAMNFADAMPPALDNTNDVVLDREAVQRLRDLRAEGFHERSPEEYCEMEWRVTRVRLVGNPELATRLESRCDLPNEWPANLAFHLRYAFPSAQKANVSPLELTSLTLPVLSIHGTLDRNAPYGSGVEWAAMLPNARLRTVEGAAHHAWADDPSVLHDIDEFLDGAWPEAARDVSIAQEESLSQLRGVSLLRAVVDQPDTGGTTEHLSLSVKGELYPGSQSHSASPPWDPFPHEAEILFTDGGASVVVDESLHWPDFVSRHRTVYRPGHSFELDLNRRQVVEPYRPPEELWKRALQYSPAHLIAHALQSPQPVRHLGVDRTGAQPLQLVALNLAGERVTLGIDDHNRVRSVRRLVSDPLTGDGIEIAELDGEQVIGGYVIPRMVRRTIDGVPSAAFEVSAGPDAELSRFEIPEGFTERATREDELVLEEVATDVWIARNIGGADYKALVVVHDDGLVLLETPQNEEAMNGLITLAREHFPDRPIKAAVVTHHHYDHSGGVRAAMAAGATIYVPRGSEELFLRIAAAPRTLAATEPKPIDVWSLQLEGVDQAVIVPATRGPEIRLFALGENDHAEGILFAWIPDHRILFQGDLLVKYGDDPEPARSQGVVFYHRIKALELDPERIIGVHGRIATMADLENAVAKAER